MFLKKSTLEPNFTGILKPKKSDPQKNECHLQAVNTCII